MSLFAAPATGYPVVRPSAKVREVHVASVSESIAARLRVWDVDRVFGYPGPDVYPLVTVLTGERHAPEFVHTRHEDSAALMACAHAKLTGRVGCCLAASRSGALHLLSGLYDAALDRQPVVAIVGEEVPPPVTGRGRTAIRATQHFAEVSVYCEPVSDPTMVGKALDRAFQASLLERGGLRCLFPAPFWRPGRPRPSGVAKAAPVLPRPPQRSPGQRDVRRAADVLNAGSRVAIVLGPGAAEAVDQVVAIADLLAAGVAKTCLARDVVPDDLPYVAGVTEPFGSAVAAALLRNCDTLLLVGVEDFHVGLAAESDRHRGRGRRVLPGGR